MCLPRPCYGKKICMPTLAVNILFAPHMYISTYVHLFFICFFLLLPLTNHLRPFHLAPCIPATIVGFYSTPHSANGTTRTLRGMCALLNQHLLLTPFQNDVFFHDSSLDIVFVVPHALTRFTVEYSSRCLHCDASAAYNQLQCGPDFDSP